MNFKHYTFLLLTAFVIPLSSFAEPMVINCDNYLNENNLVVSVVPVKNNEIKAGETLDLNGTVTNKNNFPIADYGVYVKIVKKQTEDDIKSNGLNIIDQFYPLQKSYLPESKNGMNSVRNFSTVWKVPESLPRGEYGVVSYIISNNKIIDDNFNLKPKQTSYFQVTDSTSSDELSIDRNTVLLNGKKYARDLLFEGSEPVKISFTIKNLSNKKIDGTVIFKTYEGDLGISNDITKSSSEYISLDANTSKEISCMDYGSLNTNSKTVVELYYGDAKDVLNIDYKRSGYNNVSIPTLGLNKFPIKNGYTVPLYVCYKSEDGKNIENTNLKIDVIDSDSSLVYTESIKIDVDSLLRGYIFPIKFNKEYAGLTIKANILKDDKSLASRELNYDCNQSNDGKCGNVFTVSNVEGQNETTSERVIIVSITMLLFVGTAIYFLKHKKNTSPADTNE